MPMNALDPQQFEPEQWARLEGLRAQMQRDGIARKAPMREIFARLGDRWCMLLLQILRTGPMRSAQLRRVTSALSAEGEISQRIFTLQIRLLEEDGLIMRTITPTVPPRVDYALSSLGISLLESADHVMNWVRHNREALLALQTRDERTRLTDNNNDCETRDND